MLSRQEAQERLKAFRNLQSSAEQLARLKKLPARISAIGQFLIQDGPVWKKLQKDFNRRGEIRRDFAGEIIALPSKQRQALFAAILPGIAPFLEETWKLFDRLPYQDGPYRRPFRSPRQPLSASRVSMLQNLVHSLLWRRRSGVCLCGCHRAGR
jgi:hypothetical protein